MKTEEMNPVVVTRDSMKASYIEDLKTKCTGEQMAAAIYDLYERVNAPPRLAVKIASEKDMANARMGRTPRAWTNGRILIVRLSAGGNIIPVRIVKTQTGVLPLLFQDERARGVAEGKILGAGRTPTADERRAIRANVRADATLIGPLRDDCIECCNNIEGQLRAAGLDEVADTFFGSVAPQEESPPKMNM